MSLRAGAPNLSNRLLAPLPRADRKRFIAVCEPVLLTFAQVLAQPGAPLTHAYFPTDAIVSLGLADVGEPSCFEVALVGREGMVGLPLLLGASRSALRSTVVRTGAGLRIAVAALHAALLGSPALAKRTQLYAAVALAQMAQATLCTRYHRLDQRLARWLLMTQDRAQPGELHATHEFLATTLGVRRAGVSRAAASLQRRGLIAYHRGVLAVVDRPGLQAAACTCYATDRASYDALMRPR